MKFFKTLAIAAALALTIVPSVNAQIIPGAAGAAGAGGAGAAGAAGAACLAGLGGLTIAGTVAAALGATVVVGTVVAQNSTSGTN